MKLVTYLQNGIEQIGVLTPAEDAVVPAGMLGLDFADMAELAVQMTDAQRDTAAALLPAKSRRGNPSGTGEAAGTDSPTGTGHHLSGRKLFRTRQGKCRRYGAGIRRRTEVPGSISPSMSTRRSLLGDSINGHFDIVTDLDYEVEMAFVVRKDIQGARAEDAASYVFGYTIMNDVSARCISDAA